MKVLRITAIWFAAAVVSLTAEMCIKPCPEPLPAGYSISSFQLNTLDEESISWVMEGRMDAGEPEDTSEYRKDFGVELVFDALPLETAAVRPAGSPFIQSAYALEECIKYIYHPADSIVSIRVFADKDFGESHPAGTDVAEFFMIREWNGYTPYPWLTTFEDYLKRPAPVFIWGSTAGFNLLCLFTATAIDAGEYGLRFVVGLSDGRELEQSVTTVLKHDVI